MQKDIPLTIEKLSEEQERECCITSVRQIQSILRKLSDEGSRIALYYDDERDSIMTSLLGVGDKGFWVEQGTDTSKNRHISGSKAITLVSSLDRVKIQFAANGASPATHQGCSAFHLPLPSSLYRLQRRQYYRLAVPSSERLRCVIPINMRGRVEMPITDISGGGVRLSYERGDIELVPGQIYTDCEIDLPEVGKISVTITVKSLVSISPKQGQMARRVGCEFTDIDAASSVLLQRYVTKMQCIKTDAE